MIHCHTCLRVELVLFLGGRANLLEVRHVKRGVHSEQRLERETLGLQTLLPERRSDLKKCTRGWS